MKKSDEGGSRVCQGLEYTVEYHCLSSVEFDTSAEMAYLQIVIVTFGRKFTNVTVTADEHTT